MKNSHILTVFRIRNSDKNMVLYDGDGLRGKFVCDDKDQGLGTSGEDSSESSSSKSQRRRITEDELQRQRYLEGWRRATTGATPAHVRSHSYHNGGYLSDDDIRPWNRPFDRNNRCT
uniref:Patched domain-containing protein 3 n=1 Tax=Triatoma infestans TaxID=30076 RepID=A0A161M2W6_TRIIF